MQGKDSKKTYAKPQLIMHGSVEDLTKDDDTGTTDAMGGSGEVHT